MGKKIRPFSESIGWPQVNGRYLTTKDIER
jgi:hypothetical protein